MTPVAQGRVPGDLIALDLSQREDNFGFVFTGKLPVAEAGKHLFMMRSDDGSRLYINGNLIIDHDGLHGDGEVKLAEIDLATGTQEVRIEYFEGAVAHNLQVDWVGPEGQNTRLPPLSAQGRITDVRRFIVEVGDEPQVWRVLLPGSSPRSITVGLPGQISYSFDPEAAAVQYAWQGGFLNRGGMVGHGQGRGPESVEILGSRFEVGTVAKPLRIGDPATEPAIRWLGYRNDGRHVFLMYEVDGQKVTQTVEAAPNRGTGLVHHFEFAHPPREPVHFLIEGGNLELTASAGSWNRSGLVVPTKEARRFSVTVLHPGR